MEVLMPLVCYVLMDMPCLIMDVWLVDRDAKFVAVMIYLTVSCAYPDIISTRKVSVSQK